MKRFLYVDDSGRGFTAEWTADEILADIAKGDAGTFGEFDTIPDYDGEDFYGERLSEWVERCDAGQEFELDAAHLVCTGDDCTAPVWRREAFTTETTNNGQRVVIRDESGNVVAELQRLGFGDPLHPPGSPTSKAHADMVWQALAEKITRP